MKIIFLFFTFAFMIIVESNAEADFKSGYIITLQYDTIFGKIANTSYSDHSIYCTFKESKTNEITKYYPNQIAGYRFVDGKYYVSKEIVVDSIKTQFFMEYLINGKLSLFFRQDENTENHYYAEKDSVGIRELEYGKDIIRKDGSDWEKTNTKYVGLLTYLTYDCAEVANEIPKMNEPDHKRLIGFAKKYHDKMCSDQTCIIYEKKMPRKIKLQVFGGSVFGFFSPSLFSNNEITYNSLFHQSYGFNILFQQTQRSESLYLGIGTEFERNTNNFVLSRIPLSVNYLNPRMGFSPTGSIELDLNTFCATQAFKAGVKYQMKKIALNLSASLKTFLLKTPYNAGLNLELMYDLR